MAVDEVKLQALKYICQKVINDPDMLPSAGRTYCNIAVNRICTHLGYGDFSGLLANQIYDKCVSSDEWCRTTGEAANRYSCEGKLCLAVQKGTPHGHCNVIYPSKMVYSGKWKEYVPQAANVGIKNGIMSVNYCFREPPTYVALRRDL